MFPSALVVAALACVSWAEPQCGGPQQQASPPQGGDGSCSASGGGQQQQLMSAPAPQGPRPLRKQPRPTDRCGLYMAQSSIPGAGWGVYTGLDLEPRDAVLPLDVGLSFVDYDEQMRLFAPDDLPEWLLEEYHWTPIHTHALFDAKTNLAFLPGLGMLANSHAGLFNLHNDGPRTRQRVNRTNPSAGSMTHLQQVSFSAMRRIPAGSELFVEYGDEWFSSRPWQFGECPLSQDYETANHLLNSWDATMLDIHSDLAKHVYQELLIAGMSHWFSHRTRNALPPTYREAVEAVSKLEGAAAADLNTPRQSTEWLEEHGLCLDDIDTKESAAVKDQQGAFARRAIAKGEVVAPAPMIHLSREHLKYRSHDGTGEAVWEGHQLMLNYCYGHASSSILLFPYSPGVNLINHGKKANIALRWSDKMLNPELLNLTAAELLERNEKAGLLMEFYALRNLRPGEELYFDYGSDWEKAWNEHERTWQDKLRTMAHGLDYKSPWDYELDQEIYTLADETAKYPPHYIQVRVWVDEEKTLKKPPNQGWYRWEKHRFEFLDTTLPCTVDSAYINDKGEKENFRVTCKDSNGRMYRIMDVPWHAITFVEKPYTGHQYLRDAFRHEMELPEELIPDSWKDLKEYPSDQCGLYMAESAIPNAGLGMYTAKAIKDGDKIFDGDVVIQVEDYDVNQRLGRWYRNETDDGRPWLLDSYYWNAEVSMGQFEAEHIQSIIPGLGMLANSHPGLVNAEVEKPSQTTYDLHRSKDPGAGAMSNFVDFHYTAAHGDIQAGEELFVKYGDHWFRHREDLGPIPLSHDFRKADALVHKFFDVVGGDTTTSLSEDMWSLVVNSFDEKKVTDTARMVSALPKSIQGVETVLKDSGGSTAKYSTPDRLRSPEWLQQHGQCLDNITPRRSTMRQAGMGAFATRALAKDQVIHPMPLVHISRTHLQVYDSEDFEDPDAPVKYLGQQLLLNYCFGHKSSSLLLFPYSPVANYINHGDKPNAMLRWSKLPQHQASWLTKTPKELVTEHDHAGLILEVVATRDIKADEEVLIDYGAAWSSAWTNHLQTWQPEPKADSYVAASVLNERKERVRTLREMHVDPYPGENNIGTACYIGSERRPLPQEQRDPKIKIERQFVWRYYHGIFLDRDQVFACDVIKRHEIYEESSGGEVFAESPADVEDRKDSILPVDVRYTIAADMGEKKYVFTQVPRSAIFYYDLPYLSDLGLRSAFRYEIQLPDDMVPNAWRDLN